MKPYAFFVSETISLGAGLLPLALRSLISRIVQVNEVGQVFTVLSCLEAVTPILFSMLFSLLFNLTIVSYPGFIYHGVALLIFYPYLLLIYADLTKEKWLESKRPPRASKAQGTKKRPEVKTTSKKDEKSPKSAKPTDFIEIRCEKFSPADSREEIELTRRNSVDVSS